MTEETLRPLYYAVTHFDAKTNEVNSEPQTKLSDVDLARFVETDILKSVLCEDLNFEATKDTICSLAYDNEIFSTHSANVLVELVLRRQIESTMQTNKQPQDLDILPHLFVTLSALMAVKDSLRQKRIDRIMPQLIKVFKFNMKSSSQADYAMRWLLSEAHSLEEIREWLIGHLDAWLADLLISSPFDSVRRCAEEMVHVVVSNKCISYTVVMLQPLLNLLPICAKHAGPAADKVIARKANSPKTKSWKLASYFRLLKAFTKTKEQKIHCASNWPRLRKLLKLIIDEEKDNDLELNQNKYTLCDLLYHLVSECPANLHIVCDDIEAMARVLDCFINLRGLPETVSYNESMIPLGYKLVTICVKRNPGFIPQVLLPNHHTFEWSILKFCQSTKYPKSSQALFDFLQLVVEHPDMDAWRQRRIKAALVDDNDNPFSHNPLRLLTLFDALIRTERDGQVFCDNDGLNILHRFMQTFKENPGVDPEQETLVCNLAALVISKAQRGDLRLKKEKEARATRAREELLALLDEEEDTAKRKKQRSKRKRSRQKRQRQQKALQHAKQSDIQSSQLKSDSDSSTSNSTGRNSSSEDGRSKPSPQMTTNNKSTSPTNKSSNKSSNKSTNKSTKNTKHKPPRRASSSSPEEERSSEESIEDMKGPFPSNINNHQAQSTHSTHMPALGPTPGQGYPTRTPSGPPLSSTTTSTPTTNDSYYITPPQLQTHTSHHHHLQQHQPLAVNTNHTANHTNISPTSNRNTNANHLRDRDMTDSSRQLNANGSSTTLGNDTAQPHVSHLPFAGSTSSRSSSVSVSPVQTPCSVNSGDVPVPVKPPSVTADLLPNSTSAAANGWHTVTNAQHKILQRDNKKLQQKNLELQKEFRKVEQKNKRLSEYVAQVKEDHEHVSSELEVERNSKKQTLEDLRSSAEKVEDLQSKLDSSAASCLVLEKQLQVMANPREVPKFKEEDRYANLCCHTEQELQSMSDEALDSMEICIESAKRQLFQEKDNLDIAAERVESSKRDRLCMVCIERPKSVMVHPCRHIIVCPICAPRIAVCPICQKKIDERDCPNIKVNGIAK